MSSFAVGIVGYSLLLAIVVGLTVTSLRGRTRVPSRVPTPGHIARSIRRTRAGRILLALGWAWVGWHLFVR